MNEKMSHQYEPFVIEKDKIKAFAKSIGLQNPIYFDKDVACQQGYRDIPVPPTFATVIEFSNDRNYYDFFEACHLLPEHVLHGEQAYEYIEDICANDTITAKLTVENIEKKRNKVFYYVKTIYQNQFAKTVLISRSTLIEIKEVTGYRKDN